MSTTYEYENIKIELQDDIDEFLAGRIVQKVMDEGYDVGDIQVLDDETADIMTVDYIRESVWAFNADFLAFETDMPIEVFEAMGDGCESSNDAILKIIEKTCGLKEFAESAISADGRGHYLSSYDGEENEIEIDGTTYYVYRVD